MNDVTKNKREEVIAVADTLYVLSGKWKLPIIKAICHGQKRFKEISENVPGITARMLSRELKDMEMNKLISRTVNQQSRLTIEYTFTDYAKSLGPVISEMIHWGKQHRKEVLK